MPFTFVIDMECCRHIHQTRLMIWFFLLFPGYSEVLCLRFTQDHCRAVLAVNTRWAKHQQIVFLLPDLGLFYWYPIFTVGAG
jgi:hypothetical protein